MAFWTSLLSQPHFEASVRMKLALPKVGTWSPPGLSQFQSSIAEVKTPRLEVFFIPLKRSWSVDVENGLAWTIQTLQHKLWSKERPGVKLAIWPPTIKSRESTRPRCVQVECDTPLESSSGELQVCFRPRPDQKSEPGVMSYQSPRSSIQNSFETPPWESRDPRLKAILMQVWQSNIKNIIWGKVVASPESGLWWIKWIRVACDLSQHQECFRKWINQLVVGFWCRTE